MGRRNGEEGVMMVGQTRAMGWIFGGATILVRGKVKLEHEMRP